SVDIDERDGEGLTPLHAALLARQLESVRVLLDAGAKPNRRVESSSALHIAVALGAFPRHKDFAGAAVHLLLQQGADPTAKDDRTHTPLHVAAALGVDACLEPLLAVPTAPELVDLKDRQGNRPLHAAAAAGHVPAVTALLAAGATVGATDLLGLTPLHAA
ncbi:unnamed protein product, partial [Phaeothamnion confervicola]